MEKAKLSYRKKLVMPIVASIIVFLAGCQGRLDPNTSGILSPQTFYESKSDMRAAVIPMYRELAGAFKNAQGMLPLFAGDDLTTRPAANKQPFRNWDTLDYSVSSGWLNGFVWKPHWNAIRAANVVLANLNPEKFPDSFTGKIAGQAHFIRGLAYYNLVRIFGGVPLITTANPTGKESRATVLEVYKLIEKDLKYAASHLPAVWPSGTKGRATSGAAKTALASLYMTWAGWPLENEDKWALAAQYAKEVMESGIYRLMDKFRRLWKPAFENNRETIFSIQWDLQANNYSNTLAQGFAPIESNGWVDGFAEIGFFKRMPEGPRKKWTFLTEFKITGTDKTVHWTDSQFGHPTYQKWTLGAIPKGGQPYRFSGVNYPIFRYAHVLLTYAEAKTMAVGAPTASAYRAVNLVRNRAGLKDLPRGLSKMEFKKAVVRERAWEFAGEYTRWFDLVRTETVVPVLKENRAAPEFDIEWATIQKENKEEYYISPIPAIELANNPNLEQNPQGNVFR